MAAQDHLSGIQFRTYHDPERNDGYVQAHRGDEDLGDLSYSGLANSSTDWRPSITNLSVYEPENRRKGLATAMYQHAMTQTGGRLQHGAERTDDGDAFAQKTGGVIPSRIPIKDF